MNSTSLSVLRYFAKRTSLSVSDLAVICNQSAHIFVPHFKYLLDNGFIEPDPQASDPSTEIKLRSKFALHLPVKTSWKTSSSGSRQPGSKRFELG